MTELEMLKINLEMADINYKLDFIYGELDDKLPACEREQYKLIVRRLEARYKELENKLWNIDKPKTR